jgi:hypothetical protein
VSLHGRPSDGGISGERRDVRHLGIRQGGDFEEPPERVQAAHRGLDADLLREVVLDVRLQETDPRPSVRLRAHRGERLDFLTQQLRLSRE